jgi:AsmA protein
MKAIKVVLYGMVGLVALAVVALGAAFVIVDGKFVKARLESAMKEKNRTLNIEGEPRLALFPVFRLTLGKTTLSEPKSDKAFVSLESLDVAVKVMPLVSGEVAVDVLALSGLRANIVRAKDGSMNFDDLAGKREGEPAEKKEPPRVRIAEVKIERAQISYTDLASGQTLAIGDLNLKTGRLEDDAPTPLALSASIAGKRPEIALKAQLEAVARINLAAQAFAFSKLDARLSGNAGTLHGLDLRLSGDLAADVRRQEYTVDTLGLQAKGTLERDALTAAFSAPSLRVTHAKAEGQAVTGNLTVKGPGRSIDAKLRMSAVEGSASALSIPSLVLELDSNVAGNGVKGQISTPIKANLAARTWELPKIAANLTFSGPAIPQKTVTLPISASLRADLAKQSVTAEMSAKFDDTSVNAKLGATRLEPLIANFDVAIDKLNLDRYLPADSKDAKSDAPIDLSGLRGKTVSGKLAIGALTAKRAKLENVKAEIKLDGGKLEVAPHSASLYGGTLAGALSADANGNKIHVKETAQNVGLGALLRDVAQKDVLDGRGNVTLDVQSSGGTVTALKKALAGSARVEMKDGAIKGVNLADSARNVKSALGAKQAKPDPSQKTDFSEMSASFKIAGGVARNDDLKAASPFLRLGGAGNLDIGNNAIDYLAKATLAATAKGQGGRDASNVAGITIPVKLSGPLDSPNWHVDYSALLGGAGGSVTEIGKKGVGGVKDAVRGLFKR